MYVSGIRETSTSTFDYWLYGFMKLKSEVVKGLFQQVLKHDVFF